MAPTRAALIWAALAAALAIPLGVAATSPLLAWREPIYIVAGFAGVVGLGLLLVQPLLVGGYMPRLSGRAGRRLHGVVGAGLVAAIALHVGGLWLTSPPDVIDALLFRSPTPFSAWGVLSMWAAFAAALLVAARGRLRLAPAIWRFGHAALAATVVIGAVIHALLIEGTMGTVSKAMLCALTAGATAKALLDIRPWARLRRMRG